MKLCDQLTPEEINEFVSATVIRMHNGEWYTSKSPRFLIVSRRVCVCSLLSILYKTKLVTGDYDTVVEMYDELCKDSVPMIRRAAISVIPEFIKVMDVDSSLSPPP